VCKSERGKERRQRALHPNQNQRSQKCLQTSPVNLRDDGVDIDLLSREEIEGALKYLKNKKAAGTDSIAAELL
jgi:hypothetical protein